MSDLTPRSLRLRISKNLKAAHQPRSRWNPSSRVKGWGNFAPGWDFESSPIDAMPFEDEDGKLWQYLIYRQGSWFRAETDEDRIADLRLHLAGLQSVLQARGFTARIVHRDKKIEGTLRLKVSCDQADT